MASAAAAASAPAAAAAPPPGAAPLAGGGPGTAGDFARFGVLTVSDRASAGVYEDLSGPAILNFFADAVASPWAAEYAVVADERPAIEAALVDLVCGRWRGVVAMICLSSFLPSPLPSCAVVCSAHAALLNKQWLPAPETNKQVDNRGCCLVVTTGGTGPAPRDVTPEATEAVCSRMLPGYGEQMRAVSLKFVPTAVLSRQTAGAPRLCVFVCAKQAAGRGARAAFPCCCVFCNPSSPPPQPPPPPPQIPNKPGIRGAALIINLPGKPKSIRETFDEVFKSIPYCVQLLGGPYIETRADVVPAFRPPADRRAAPAADAGSGGGDGKAA